ncbi:Ger(x)C family spore germination protein [Paenibacillus hamazuiensis]|uniref:Ger(x)C family spore germination protein n=1 Tax=Paenibacillus hamazuiensis TaxID=2936508 RepID=UPI00200D1392|nr:Ger(x)C family spore germination protein [Paenibacillus hamazuiensis]
MMLNLSRSAIFPILCLCLLTGCWDRTEISDLAFVLAGGIDVAEDGQLESTLQIALPTQLPNALELGKGGNNQPVLVVSEKGKDGADILHKMQKRLSRHIFLGHRGVLVIGEKYARTRMDQVLDQTLRYPGSRYNMYVLTARGTTAKKILQTPYLLESIPGIGIKKIQMSGLGYSLKVDEFLNELSLPGKAPVTSAIRLFSNDTEKNTFTIDEAAVYQLNRPRLVGFLTQEEQKILKWQKGKLNETRFTAQVTPPEEGFKGTIGIEVLTNHSTMKAEMKNDMPHMTIILKAGGRVIENDSKLDLSKKADLKLAESKLTEEAEKLVKQTIRRSQQELQADIFGIGEKIHTAYPAYWKKHKDQWINLYPEIPVACKVEIVISRIGRTQLPAHILQ